MKELIASSGMNILTWVSTLSIIILGYGLGQKNKRIQNVSFKISWIPLLILGIRYSTDSTNLYYQVAGFLVVILGMVILSINILFTKRSV